MTDHAPATDTTCEPCASEDHARHRMGSKCRCICVPIAQGVENALAGLFGFDSMGEDEGARAYAQKAVTQIMAHLADPVWRAGLTRYLTAAELTEVDPRQVIAAFEHEGWTIRRGPEVSGHPHAVHAFKSVPRDEERFEDQYATIPTDHELADSDELLLYALRKLYEAARAEEIIRRRYPVETP